MDLGEGPGEGSIKRDNLSDRSGSLGKILGEEGLQSSFQRFL